MKQLQIKIVTKLTILGFRNRFGVSKASQPPESEFSIMRIEFSLFVVEAPASIMVGCIPEFCVFCACGLNSGLTDSTKLVSRKGQIFETEIFPY